MEKHKYEKEDIIVFWEPHKCTHAGICVKSLPQVYKPKERPWIQLGDTPREFLMQQIDNCPSGALSYELKDIPQDMISIQHYNNEKNGEFQATINNQNAGQMTYTWAGDDKFIIDHTHVEPEYNGKGVGKQMLLAAVEFARDNNIKIIPLCPFAAASFKKMADIQDVL